MTLQLGARVALLVRPLYIISEHLAKLSQQRAVLKKDGSRSYWKSVDGQLQKIRQRAKEAHTKDGVDIAHSISQYVSEFLRILNMTLIYFLKTIRSTSQERSRAVSSFGKRAREGTSPALGSCIDRSDRFRGDGCRMLR